MNRYLSVIKKSCSEVFKNTSYIILAIAITLLTLIFVILLPNMRLLVDILFSLDISIGVKFKVVLSLLGGISTNFSTLSASYTVGIAILFGLNISMIVYFLKRKKEKLAGKSLASGIGGIGSGVLGVGCAAFGSFLLSTILASLGATGAIAILPLKGGEFGILSVVLLLISLIVISKQIIRPQTCSVE